jgi:hypothetical protein
MSIDETIRRVLRPALLASACALPLPRRPPRRSRTSTSTATAGTSAGCISRSLAARRRRSASTTRWRCCTPSTSRPRAGLRRPGGGRARLRHGWWGVAVSQRLNPLVPPFPPAALQRGWQAIERARAAPPRTERERDWVEALAAFFQDHERVDQRTRTLAYEAAMERLAAKYPDDDERRSSTRSPSTRPWTSPTRPTPGS